MPKDTPPAPSVRIGTVATALGVSVDTLRRWEEDGRITFERRGGQRFLDADTLAQLLKERSPVRTSSARNRFEGVVIAVTRDKVMAQVELACGPFRVVSLMSREAVDELGLKPGSHAEAVIKSTNVMVETRGR
jgi:molybdopterin-binding protein